MKQVVFFLAMNLFFFQNLAFAGEEKVKSGTASVNAESTPSAAHHEMDFLQALDYPELQVVPRASEKLSLETQYEKDNGYMMFWPFHISAATTLISGLMLNGNYKDGAPEQDKSDADFATKAAIGVGAAWVGLNFYLYSLQNYGTEINKVRNIKGKDRRSELLRERLAEESLERPARIMKILTWTSVLTNLAVNANLVGRTTRDYSLYPVLGAVASFLPLIFQNRYIENYEKHLEYKRKIYAPIAYISPYLSTPNKQGYVELQPQVVLAWSF